VEEEQVEQKQDHKQVEQLVLVDLVLQDNQQQEHLLVLMQLIIEAVAVGVQRHHQVDHLLILVVMVVQV
tara:strand:- start:19 stop:225 length:207 start_codon:yes stop_codon:yes gene_type:complete